MAKSKAITLPDETNRTVVCGRTGSGKTTLGMWLFSLQNFDEMPWIILKFKDDPIIDGIEKALYITLDDPLPTRPGIYIIMVYNADVDDKRVSEWFRRVYEHTRIGLLIDEAAMLDRYDREFNNIMMQGRSLEIPCIACTQRPSGISQFLFSEANYWFVFDLIKKADREKVAGDVPIPVNYDLPEHHCYYYHVNTKTLKQFKPVPDADVILATIDARAPKHRRLI